MRKRIRRKTIYDDGIYYLRREWYWNYTLTVYDDADWYKVVYWELWRRTEDNGDWPIQSWKDNCYPTSNRKGRLKQTRFMKNKILTWLNHHKKLLSLNHTELKCNDIDGPGKLCPMYETETNECKVRFFFQGYCGGGQNKRSAPGICDGAKGPSSCLPSGLKYYYDIIRHNLGDKRIIV